MKETVSVRFTKPSRPFPVVRTEGNDLVLLYIHDTSIAAPQGGPIRSDRGRLRNWASSNIERGYRGEICNIHARDNVQSASTLEGRHKARAYTRQQNIPGTASLAARDTFARAAVLDFGVDRIGRRLP